jgi:hypothetical protein
VLLLEGNIAELKQDMIGLRSSIQSRRQYLRFKDLFDDGILCKRVNIFTFFQTVEANETFLEMVNPKRDKDVIGSYHDFDAIQLQLNLIETV